MSLRISVDGKSVLTVDWLEAKLQEGLKTTAKFQTSQVKNVGEGMGFMSQLRKVTIQWDRDDPTLPESVIVKVPTSLNAEKVFADMAILEQPEQFDEHRQKMLRTMHLSECFAYEYLTKDPCVPIPKIYYMNAGLNGSEDKTPVIIMEDLTRYQVKDLIPGINREQLLSTVEAIASLHARCITDPSSDWIDTLMKMQDPSMAEMFVGMINGTAEGLKQFRPDLFNGKVDKILEKINANPHMFFQLMEKMKNREILPVLVHGDMWTANLLFDGDRLGGIVDWGITRVGMVCEDMHRLMGCMSTKERRLHTPAALSHYYKVLTEKLQERNAQPPFTFDQLHEMYDQGLFGQCMGGIFSTGFWMNSPVVEGKDKQARIAELFDRLEGIVEDTLPVLPKLPF